VHGRLDGSLRIHAKEQLGNVGYSAEVWPCWERPSPDLGFTVSSARALCSVARLEHNTEENTVRNVVHKNVRRHFCFFCFFSSTNRVLRSSALFLKNMVSYALRFEFSKLYCNTDWSVTVRIVYVGCEKLLQVGAHRSPRRV